MNDTKEVALEKAGGQAPSRASAPSHPEINLSKDLKNRGCPVCNHLEKGLFDFLAQWQYELSNNEKMQHEFADELGFCPAHTWQLASMSSPYGLSKGFPQLLEHIAKKMSELTPSTCRSAKIADEIARLVKKPETCRVCRLLGGAEQIYINRLAAFLENQEGRLIYMHSDGVCLRHLSLITSSASNEVVYFLIAESARHLREIITNMQRYVEKHDAYESHLLNQDERYAYLRALTHIFSARNICAPHVKRV